MVYNLSKDRILNRKENSLRWKEKKLKKVKN